MASDAGTAIHTAGLRLTRQRQLVWDVLVREHGHLTADEICSEVRRVKPDFNIASVYRTLELLERLGLARSANMHDGYRTYELRDTASGHHHLVCRECESAIHFDVGSTSKLRREMENAYGDYSFMDFELVVYGYYAACKDKQDLAKKCRVPKSGQLKEAARAIAS